MNATPHLTVDVGGARVAYVESGSGAPLLLLHGGESHKRQYDMFLPHLASGIRAIAADQRDVGDASRSEGPYSMADLADDCIALMDALQLDRAHVMGISFGGAIAMHVGIRHAERVSSLILGAAPDTFQRPNPFLERALTATPEERGGLMLDASLSADAQRDESLMELLRGLTAGRVTAPGSHRSAAIASHHLTAGDLERIAAPTLLVYGELDPLVPPEVGRAVHDSIPASELVVIPGARHGLSFEFREQLGALVSDWVLNHSGASR